MLKALARELSGSHSPLPKSFLPELRKLTEKLEEWGPDFECYIEEFPDLIAISGQDYLIKINESAWYDTLGYRASEVYGEKWLTLVHPEDKKATEEVMSRLDRAPLRGVINRLRHKKGLWVPIHWTASAWVKGRTLAIGRVVSAGCHNCDCLDRKE